MTKSKRGRFSPEVRERAVRLVREQLPQHASQWAAITAIAPKLGCTAETLRRWLLEDEAAAAPGADEEARVRALEREVRELRRANGILRKVSADSMGQRNSASNRAAGVSKSSGRAPRNRGQEVGWGFDAA